MAKKTDKVVRDVGHKIHVGGNRGRIMRTTREFRKDTNQEIVQDAVNKRGFARLSVFVKVRSEKNPGLGYLGYHGASISIDVPSFEMSEQFVLRLKQSVISLAQEMKLGLPNTVIVER